jgi:hypothetical protein
VVDAASAGQDDRSVVRLRATFGKNSLFFARHDRRNPPLRLRNTHDQSHRAARRCLIL